MEQNLCWWCCHTCIVEALHLPYKVDRKTKKYRTMGNFCSWACMSAFNMEKHGLHAGSKINMLIASSHKKMTSVLKHPKPAPSRYVLKSFGGTLSIDEFRNLEPHQHPILSLPNQLHIVQVVEQVKRTIFTSAAENTYAKKLTDINNVEMTAPNDSLKLKRSRPLKRDQNNLENMMGLKREKKK